MTEPDGYAVLLDDPNVAGTPGGCGYWYVGAYRTEAVAKNVAERGKQGARVVPMFFTPPEVRPMTVSEATILEQLVKAFENWIPAGAGRREITLNDEQHARLLGFLMRERGPEDDGTGLDAERYRWLRLHGNEAVWSGNLLGEGELDGFVDEMLRGNRSTPQSE